MTCLVVPMSLINIAGFPPLTRVQNNAIFRLMVFEDCHGRRGRRVWAAGIALSAACEIMYERAPWEGSARGDPLFSFKREGYLRMRCDEQQKLMEVDTTKRCVQTKSGCR
jgi:hypothetical protein